jgi:hypothetical protein
MLSVLYGCEAIYLASGDERSLKMLEKKVLRRIYGLTKISSRLIKSNRL